MLKFIPKKISNKPRTNKHKMASYSSAVCKRLPNGLTSTSTSASASASTSTSTIRLLIAITLLVSPSAVFAESIIDNDDDFTVNIAGCYSEDGESLSSDSVCLFNDGSFYYPMLLNLTGYYQVDNNKVRFFPNQSEVFEVYARYDPTLKSHTHFNFTGFNLDSLINFNNTHFNYIPITKSACHWQAKVETYTHPRKIKEFALGYVPKEDIASQTMVTYHFELDNVLNDFLLIHHRPNVSSVPALIITDGYDKSNVWLQMGKNTLSLSKLPMNENDLKTLEKIGHKVAKSASFFPKMIDQDDNITMQNPSGYFLDKNSNRMYVDVNSSTSAKGWETLIKKAENNGNTHYLKVYKKLRTASQGMKEVVVEQRPDATSSNCL